MALPKRISKPPKASKRIRCPAHLKFVRSHHCCVPGCCDTPTEAAHVRRGTDAGVGMKPGDQYTISLCQGHHAEQHLCGELTFERRHGIDMKEKAEEFVAKSPHRHKLRAPDG